MVETTKQIFDNWTSYDDWLIKNYSEYAVFSVNEVDGKINIEYCKKAEFEQYKKEHSNN